MAETIILPYFHICPVGDNELITDVVIGQYIMNHNTRAGTERARPCAVRGGRRPPLIIYWPMPPSVGSQKTLQGNVFLFFFWAVGPVTAWKTLFFTGLVWGSISLAEIAENDPRQPEPKNFAKMTSMSRNDKKNLSGQNLSGFFSP